jgi:HK97 gp10 family phage protein
MLLGVRIQSGDQVARVFERLTPELKTRTIQAGLFRAAKTLEDAVKAAAPRGTEPSRKTRTVGTIRLAIRGRKRVRVRLRAPTTISYDYGRLRDNIKRRRLTRQFKGVPVVRVSPGPAFWGLFLERGTRRMRPHPFFQAAVKRALPEYAAAFRAEFAAVVTVAAQRLSSQVGAGARTRLRGRLD